MKTKYQGLITSVIRPAALFLLIIVFLFNSDAVHALNIDQGQIPVKPTLPSRNHLDYVQGLHYMFATGDYSLIDEMVRERGTHYYVRIGVEFFPPGFDNEEDVRSEFLNSINLEKAECIGWIPPKFSKFFIYFKDARLNGIPSNAVSYFLFMTNEEGYFELLAMGYIKDDDPLIGQLSDLESCPGVVFENEQSGNKTSPESVTKEKHSFLDNPTDVDTTIRVPVEPSFFSRIFPQAYAEGCTPRRKPIDDNDDGFIQCVEYAQEIRPDSLCWLVGGAYANKWDDYAKIYGQGIVTVSEDEPMVGDIAVWEAGCEDASKDHGHVAIVTGVKQNQDGSWMIDFDESNGHKKGAFSHRGGYPVSDCMSFIHEPGIGFDGHSNSVQDNVPMVEPSAEEHKSWWESFLCFINPWCKN